MLEREVERILLNDMQISDVPAVGGIERASFTTPWPETAFLDEVMKPGSLNRVARVSERVVGYICAGRVLDEGYILTIAVHKDFRRRGIASDLVGDVVGSLKRERCRSIFLEVRSSNEEAKKMYEKFRFRLVGTRKNYYFSPVEDALIMALNLEDLE
jgi:ribosomal-protein-alanine N-acetyltransferase